MPLEQEDDYRPNVGMMLVNAERKIFVGQRSDQPSPAWQMPQGGIDPGESPLAAALRELEEEVGTQAFELWHESSHWYTYDFPQTLTGSADRLWKGRYRGQKQRWFLFRFTGTDHDICLDSTHPEFLAWKWTTPDTLLKEIVDFKRPVYAAVLEEFLPIFQKN